MSQDCDTAIPTKEDGPLEPETAESRDEVERRRVAAMNRMPPRNVMLARVPRAGARDPWLDEIHKGD